MVQELDKKNGCRYRHPCASGSKTVNQYLNKLKDNNSRVLFFLLSKTVGMHWTCLRLAPPVISISLTTSRAPSVGT